MARAVQRKACACSISSGRAGGERGSCLNHERSHLLRVRKHRQMAGGEGQSLRAHSLRRAYFLFGRDRAIVGSDDKPTWLGVPGGRLDRRPQDGALCRSLGCEYETLFLRGEVLREILHDTLGGQEQEAVGDRLNLTEKWGGRKLLRHAAKGLTFVGSEGGYINQACHFRIVPSFGDDGAAVGMANQQYGAVLRVDKAIRRRYVIGYRAKWILDRHDM